jgi:tetratricopeptide (TPR) repeat protein
LLAAAGLIALVGAGPLAPLPPKPQTQVAQIAESAAPPISLTASDGTGLILTSLKAQAVLEDPLAFTELHLVFQNPQPRMIEGQFEITLPEGAAISRFAMRQESGWQEGEVVELQAAREAYEDFLHRRQDPALLEKQAGNQFRARVFPIPPSGTKELILSYSQERPRAADPYKIPLRGLPRLGELQIRAIVSKAEVKGGGSSLGGTTLSHKVVEVSKRAFLPDDDFIVPIDGPGDGVGLRHDNLVVGRITPFAAAQKERIDGLTVLVDTSASRALGFKAQVERLGALIGALRGAADGLQLRVLCFDQEVEAIFSGPARDFGPRELGRILDRRALGASDLGAALAALGKEKTQGRLLIVSDGIFTAGPTEGAELRRRVKALGALGVRRVDALTFGGIRDEPLLSRLVTAGLAGDGVVIDGDEPVGAVAERLQRATRSGIRVSVPGSAWAWPAQLDGVQQGDQVLVYADLPRGQPFEVVLEAPGGKAERQAIRVAEAPRPLLQRAVMGARIRKLMHQRDTLAEKDEDLREGLRRQIIELSTRHRVLSDFTALLILETEADYARFRIDRRALSDILTVGPGGIDVIDRKKGGALILARPTPPPPADLPVVDADGIAEGGEAMKEPAAPASRPGAKNGARNKDVGKADKAAPEKPAKRAPAEPRQSFNGGGAPPPAAGPMGAPAMGAPVVHAPMPEPAAAAPPRPRPQPEMKVRADAAQLDLREERKTEGARRQDSERMRSYRGGSAMEPSAPPPPPPPSQSVARRPPAALAVAPKPPETAAYEGKLRTVMELLKQKRAEDALRTARAWRDEEPGDVLALIALGESFEAQGQRRAAARAYGSLIDLFPSRADMRRFAGERLERLGAEGLQLAMDTFEKAQGQRADHPSSHRLLAFALVKAGRLSDAFTAIEKGIEQRYPSGRFAGVDRVLREDAGLIAAAWLRREPGRRDEVLRRLSALGGQLPERPSLRFVLNWETDANDVDFHIYDGQGGHAYYSSRALPSGGELYADVTTGYGPECFTIEGPAQAYPYTLQAHYYSRGPMGYGMGKLEIIEHDGKGGLRFAERPFVIMVDRAFVDLGQVSGPLK